MLAPNRSLRPQDSACLADRAGVPQGMFKISGSALGAGSRAEFSMYTLRARDARLTQGGAPIHRRTAMTGRGERFDVWFPVGAFGALLISIALVPLREVT